MADSTHPQHASFQYNSIQANEFRLLHIDETKDGAYLLKAHAVSDAPAYNALSYVWGSQEPTVQLQCRTSNDQDLSVFWIRPNLSQALVELRTNPSLPRLPIWIDAICIDQQNQPEKAEQIPKMAEIYTNAAEVLVWLGVEENDSDMAMETITWLGSTSEERLQQRPVLEHRYLMAIRQAVMAEQEIRYTETAFNNAGLPPLQHAIWPAIGHLYCRGWLERVWTYQEAMLAQKCSVVCGTRVASWRSFKRIASALTQCQLLFHALSFGHAATDRPAINPMRAWETPLISDSGQDRFWLHLSEIRRRKVYLEADRIYGVLATAPPAFRRLVPAHFSDVNVRDQYWRLYIETTRLMFSTDYSCILLTNSFTASSIKHPKIPSWCPDYDQPPDCAAFCPRACAGMSRPLALWLLPDPGRIIAGGISVDQITKVVADCPYDWPHRDLDRIYGPRGCAARITTWLDFCFALVSQSIEDQTEAQEVFCNTIVGNLSAPGENHPEFPAQYREWMPILRARLRELSIAIGPGADADNGLDHDTWAQIQPLLGWIGKIWRNRVFFKTKQGRFGFAHKSAAEGDTISIFFGMTHPQVVRCTEVGPREETPGVYRYISEAYVGGLMVGEMKQQMLKQTSQAFELA